MVNLLSAIIAGLSLFSMSEALKRVDASACAGQGVVRRQDTITSFDGLQPFTSTLGYSYYSYTPVPQTDTTTFDSVMVTTSTIITVYASDQFHALQSFLTAGQSVIDSISSSAAQATQLTATLASTTASITAICTNSVTAEVVVSNTLPTSTSSTSTASATTAAAMSTQSPQNDAPVAKALGRIQQCAALALAAFLANH